MSTRQRKGRKRASIPFVKKQKVGTPVEERSFVTQPVMRSAGDAIPAGFDNIMAPRSPRRVQHFIASGGVKRGSLRDA